MLHFLVVFVQWNVSEFLNEKEWWYPGKNNISGEEIFITIILIHIFLWYVYCCLFVCLAMGKDLDHVRIRKMNEVGISFGCESIDITKYNSNAYPNLKWKFDIFCIASWLNPAYRFHLNSY